MGSQQALHTGKTKDKVLAACARQLWVDAAIHDHTVQIVHKPGADIPLADALSRQHLPQMVLKAKRLVVEKNLTRAKHVSPHPYFTCI